MPNGTVLYDVCKTDIKVFTFDKSNTSNTPDPITKGTEVTFNLAGKFNDIVNVTSVNVHVDLQSTPIYDNKTTVSNNYNASDVVIPQKWHI